jgi:LPXTG-motif cell wall-anchored protein
MKQRIAAGLVGMCLIAGPVLFSAPAFAADPTPTAAPETGGGATCSGTGTAGCGQEGSGSTSGSTGSGSSSGSNSGSATTSNASTSSSSTNSAANLPTTLPSTGSSHATQLAHTGTAQSAIFGLSGGALLLLGAGFAVAGRRRTA